MCILVSMSIPCQIWNGGSGIRGRPDQCLTPVWSSALPPVFLCHRVSRFASEKQDGFRGYELSKEQLPSLSSGYSGSDLQVLAEMVTIAS